MINLYAFTTPNGRKASIALEELGIEYNVHKIDITKGDRFTPEFVAINPNSKIPAIVDTDTGMTVFESGAILMYLAEKIDYAISRYEKETLRLYGVLDT